MGAHADCDDVIVCAVKSLPSPKLLVSAFVRCADAEQAVMAARFTHAAPPSLEESMSLMEELCRLYSCDDDKHKVLELRTARAQVDHILRQREEHMAHILHGTCPATPPGLAGRRGVG